MDVINVLFEYDADKQKLKKWTVLNLFSYQRKFSFWKVLLTLTVKN